MVIILLLMVLLSLFYRNPVKIRFQGVLLMVFQAMARILNMIPPNHWHNNLPRDLLRYRSRQVCGGRPVRVRLLTWRPVTRPCPPLVQILLLLLDLLWQRPLDDGDHTFAGEPQEEDMM